VIKTIAKRFKAHSNEINEAFTSRRNNNSVISSIVMGYASLMPSYLRAAAAGEIHRIIDPTLLCD